MSLSPLSAAVSQVLEFTLARLSGPPGTAAPDREVLTRATLFLRSSAEGSSLRDCVGAWLALGQFHEREGSNEGFGAALFCFDRAIESARIVAAEQPADDATLVLASACMNRGNVLRRTTSQEGIAAAISSYEETIRLIESVSSLNEAGLLMKGAAWMNLGVARQKTETPEGLRAAVAAHANAAEVFRTLPLTKEAHFRRSLAAACTNRGAAGLALGEKSKASEALSLAREALDLLAGDEMADFASADQMFRSRRLFCEASDKLIRAEVNREKRLSLIAAASDEAELALSRLVEWEARKVFFFRPFCVWFLNFGAALYATYQPQFLAEYLEEWLGTQRFPVAPNEAETFQRIIRENLALARTQVREMLFTRIGTPEAALLTERLEALRAAEQRWNRVTV